MGKRATFESRRPAGRQRQRDASDSSRAELQGSQHGPRRGGSRRSRQTDEDLTEADLQVAKALAQARRHDESSGRVRRRIQVRETDGSTVFRNRRQLAPHLATTGVLGAGELLHLIDNATGEQLASSAVFYTSLGAATTLAAIVVHKTVPRRWRRRVLAAVAGGAMWLAWATASGITWTSTGVLLLIEVLCAARWWHECRLGYPDGKPMPPVKPVNAVVGPDRDNIPGLWDVYIGAKDGALAGSYLHSRVVDKHRESYTVELVPGKQSLDKALGSLDRIQSGLRRPQEEIILEPHPSGDSAQLKLTVVTRSPIKDAVIFDGPKYFHEGHDGWIEIGPYADGDGRVRVSMYAANSARHVVIFGGQGSGKTALLNQMAVSAQASGHTTVWYLDGQDGVSSPQLMRYADWAPTGPDRAEVMLRALERVFAIRGKIMQANRLAGLSPSKDLPGLVVIIDECHLIWQAKSAATRRVVRRWVNLASLARKLDVAFWAATQHPELASFGDSDKLRSLLMQYTTLVLRTTSGVANTMLRLDLDPSKLPTLPGYGYLIAGDKAEGIRSAPFRADFLDDADGTADAWFEKYPSAPLDRATAKAAGPAYYDRVAIAEQRERDLEVELDAFLEDDTPLPDLADEPDGPDELREPDETVGSGPGEAGLELGPVPRFPDPIQVDAACEGLTPSQVLVRNLVADGITRAAEVAEATNLSTSQTYKLLGELVDTGHITKTGHGRYEIATNQTLRTASDSDDQAADYTP